MKVKVTFTFKGYNRALLKLIYKKSTGVRERVLAFSETVKSYWFVSAGH